MRPTSVWTAIGAGLVLAACGRNGEPTPAAGAPSGEIVLDAAQRAIGTWPTPERLHLFADASVEGPSGGFHTLVHSADDGRVRMEQPENGFLAGVGRSGGWRLNASSGEIVGLDGLEALVRTHEIHMLALLPRSRASDPGPPERVQLETGTALAVSLALATGDSLVAYFDPADTLPVGLRVPWADPSVDVRWSGWDDAGGTRLFREATFTQGPEVFRYTFDSLSLAPIPDSVFEPPVTPGSGRPDP